LERRKKSESNSDAELATFEVNLAGVLLEQQQKLSEAESLAREVVAIREKSAPNDWRTFNARGLLGACLAAEKKFHGG